MFFLLTKKTGPGDCTKRRCEDVRLTFSKDCRRFFEERLRARRVAQSKTLRKSAVWLRRSTCWSTSSVAERKTRAKGPGPAAAGRFQAAKACSSAQTNFCRRALRLLWLRCCRAGASAPRDTLPRAVGENEPSSLH